MGEAIHVPLRRAGAHRGELGWIGAPCLRHGLTVMADRAPDFELLVADRPDLSELSAEQIAPIEARMTDWPESWRDIARSLYITLVSRRDALAADMAADMAVELMMGVVADMPGAQPYINCGSDLWRSRRVVRILDLLGKHRQDYDRVGQLVGLTPRHIRRIESAWLRAERARRQRELW